MKDPNETLPSLNALRAFEAASRHLSFRRAAEELGVTEGAVGQHIRGLETALALKLFERKPRALALTENGQSYAVSVRRAFDLLVEATQALRPQPLKLAMTVTPTFAAKWLIPRLPDFTAAHPEIDLRIVATERLSHFQTDGVDLAVRYGSPPFGAGLNAELLFDDILIAVAAPRALAGARKANGIVARHALLHDAHNLWPQFLAQIHQPLPSAAKKHIRFNQTSLAIDAALEGQGIALAHWAFVARDVAAGRLTRVFEDELRTDAGFYLVFPRKLQHPEPVAKLREWLHQQASAQSQAASA
ncbi:Glycine cleavage system transcriptional activator [Paraburkholderia caffeinitolerans]|uniref:Glycine cleavage system transcriptional activator n=1 Tax=Paraburkholderia caffeinitolerans TaxID=1723730 RepID=A0A6J5G6C0_9BURK|nr:LysR substrate-binding domain-containing protein [Paraburkholderia caffeinitolerans]CAB3792402.1 Glycine cleavage system transcriptional activator [Paraburkholderia caffeinitolerans]